MRNLVILIALTVAVSGCIGGSDNPDDGDVNETLDKMEKELQLQSVNFTFPSLYEDQDTSELKVILKNEGSVTVEVSQLDLLYSQGQEFQSIPNNCFEGDRDFIDTGASFTCDTGLEFPENDTSLKLEMSNRKTWETTCNPNSSSSVMC